ncbi:MAG: ABC transporter ATP-binding protein [Lentisphaeria bacterium]
MAERSENQQLHPAVEARGLTKIFKDFWGRPKAKAVNGVDFKVQNGRVLGLLGPNGSGKSTTVKMLLGLLYPTRGQLSVLGESPERVDTKRRIGYLPEESYLYPYLTASESLDFFGSLFALNKVERRKRCEQLLEMVGLTSARNRPVGEFSKGMARRIGLAQALVNDPELVILDEPTAGLDPIGCREVKDVIKLLAERGKTIILCSHLLADVEDVCDELIVLYGGKICAHGGLRNLLKVEDRTRIMTPRLEKDELDQIIAVLRKTVGRAEIDIDQPSMNLEELFLDVIQKAREASTETAGAEMGGRIADYLQEDTGEKRRESLLEKLTATEESKKTDTGKESTTALQTEQKRANTEKIKELMQEQEGTKNSREAGVDVSSAENRTETDRAASERLEQLLGKPKTEKGKDDGQKDRNQENE